MIAPALSVVVWKWTHPDRPADFKAEYVNILAASIRRHLPLPHRFICVTDDRAGLDSSVEAVEPPAEAMKLSSVPAPKGVRFPSSYRRLWNFSAEAAELFGPRILALDIDVIVTGDLTPLFKRTDDFVSWWDARFKWGKIPGGIYSHSTGTRTHVWKTFCPVKSPRIAERAGKKGSDQGWMSYLLFPQGWTPGEKPGHPAWTAKDGVYSLKWLTPGEPLPPHVRIVSTPGFAKPWSPEVQRAHPWIKQHWRI